MRTLTNDPNVVWGPVGYYDPSGYGVRPHRTIAQLVEISAVNGATIVFDTPITYPFHTAYTAQLTTFAGSMLHGAGFEDMFIWGGEGADGQGGIATFECAYCWVKNVEVLWLECRRHQFQASLSQLYCATRSCMKRRLPHPGGGGYHGDGCGRGVIRGLG